MMRPVAHDACFVDGPARSSAINYGVRRAACYRHGRYLCRPQGRGRWGRGGGGGADVTPATWQHINGEAVSRTTHPTCADLQLGLRGRAHVPHEQRLQWVSLRGHAQTVHLRAPPQPSDSAPPCRHEPTGCTGRPSRSFAEG